MTRIHDPSVCAEAGEGAAGGKARDELLQSQDDTWDTQVNVKENCFHLFTLYISISWTLSLGINIRSVII